MKKCLLVWFCIFLLSAVCAFAQNEEIVTYTSGNWDYIENKTGITLTVWHGTAAALEIPELLDEKPVTQLGNNLFKNTALESVYIPDSVTGFGSNVFYGCIHLTDVRLPQDLTALPNSTFRYCIELEQIDIPFSVTNIGPYAFADCVKLQEVILLSITSIGDSAFDNCQSLSSVMVSRKINSIGTYAFRDTPWLEAQKDEFVIIGNGILIKWNGSGTDVQVPYEVKMISDAFDEQYFIETVTVPESVQQIGANAFRDAISLRSVNLPPYLTTIGGNAFNGCRRLESIELPAHIKTLGGSAFSNCDSLTGLTIPPEITAIPGSLLANCPSLIDVVIPESVTKIDKSAFTGSPNVRPYVSNGSEAERILKEYEIPYYLSTEVTTSPGGADNR